MADKSAASRRRRKIHERIVAILRPDILMRDRYRCVYCRGGAFEVLTVDHKLPISRDGESTMKNCVACCSRCNEIKADMTAEEFLALPRADFKFNWPCKGQYRP